MQALIQNVIQQLVPKPKDTKPISCEWMHNLKMQPNGLIN